LLFGAGHHEQTGAETDGGNFVRKTLQYRQSGGVKLKLPGQPTP
jgi:hypothetical protein